MIWAQSLEPAWYRTLLNLLVKHKPWNWQPRAWFILKSVPWPSRLNSREYAEEVCSNFGNTTLWIRNGIQLVVSYRPTAYMNWTACFGAHIESAAVVIHHRACERFYKLNEFQISPTAQHLHRESDEPPNCFHKLPIASLAHHVIIADLLYDRCFDSSKKIGKFPTTCPVNQLTTLCHRHEAEDGTERSRSNGPQRKTLARPALN